MTDTSGLWGAGVAVLAGALVVDTIRKTQDKHLREREHKRDPNKEHCKRGYGIW